MKPDKRLGSRTGVHLSSPGAPHLGRHLQEVFAREGYEPAASMEDSQIALFVDDGDELGNLEEWLYEVSTVPSHVARWVCMPDLGARKKRSMAQDIRLLAPTGPTQAAFEERLLGELYVHDPSRPEKSHLVGRSAAMVCLAAELKQFSCSDIPVLLCGESGTGKELCAKTLHEHRGKGISLPVNCASLKPDMIESELFGHVRGAFTGANTARQGLLLDAGTGTCFLDKIGELDLEGPGSAAAGD
jgi:transcriptional regulator of acetoin/glycerol metabolism